MRRQLAVRLMSITSCHALGSKCPSGDSEPSRPPLATSTSSRPKRSDGAAQLVEASKSARSRGTSVAAAGRADRVVRLLEPAHGAREQDEMRALGGKAPGHGGAEAARRAGDERDPAGEPLRES